MKRQIEQVEILGGNTKTPKIQCVQSKKWVFTMNNYTESELEHLEKIFKKQNIKYMFARERGGACGTPHLQGFLMADKRLRPSELKFDKFSWSRLHWEKMKGSMKNNIDYCTKEYDIGPWVKWLFMDGIVIPRPLVTLKKEHLRPWQAEIANWFEGYEDPLFGRTIHWIWEPAGNIGKTVLATYLFDSGEDVAVVSGAKKDMKYAICEMVSKDVMPKLVVLDIPRINKDHFSIAGIEEIKNGFFMSEKFESGFCRYNRPWVCCFANCRPDVSKMSADRWKVYQLVDGMLVHETATVHPVDGDIEWAAAGAGAGPRQARGIEIEAGPLAGLVDTIHGIPVNKDLGAFNSVNTHE